VGEVVPDRHGSLDRSIGDGPSLQADPRHDVQGAKARVGPGVLVNVKQSDGLAGHRSHGFLEQAGASCQGQHRSVVVPVRMKVEQKRPGGFRQRRHGGWLAPLAHVDDALERGRFDGPHELAPVEGLNKE
jgi:hypothetical protein